MYCAATENVLWVTCLENRSKDYHPEQCTYFGYFYLDDDLAVLFHNNSGFQVDQESPILWIYSFKRAPISQISFKLSLLLFGEFNSLNAYA